MRFEGFGFFGFSAFRNTGIPEYRNNETPKKPENAENPKKIKK